MHTLLKSIDTFFAKFKILKYTSFLKQNFQNLSNEENSLKLFSEKIVIHFKNYIRLFKVIK